MRLNWEDLSTITVKGGKTLIPNDPKIRKDKYFKHSSPNAFRARDDDKPAPWELVLEQNELRHQQVGEGV